MTPESRRVLIVEDDAQIRRFLRLALCDLDWQVSEADCLRVALALSADIEPDLVILDLGLPDGDGLAFIPVWRGRSDAPLLVLSARAGETDKVAALDAGADDYLSKPFGLAELLARVRALQRRHSGDPQTVRQFGRISVDLARHEVRVEGQRLHLTPIEFQLLGAFLAKPGRVLTHRQLLREVWGPGHADSAHTLRVYVGRLRHLLEADPTQPRHLLTEIGVGYRFEI